MERNKPVIQGTKGERERDREKGDVKEVNEIGNEETREWTR